MEAPWFRDGLKFSCTGCGKCCTGAPGYVFLSLPDVERLASHFQLTKEQFAKKYIRLVDGQCALIDRAGSDHCIFLKENKCQVYENRPIQCKTFPWWIQNLKEKSDWEEAALHCEGINHPQAETVPSTTIEIECLTYLDNLLEQNFNL